MFTCTIPSSRNNVVFVTYGGYVGHGDALQGPGSHILIAPGPELAISPCSAEVTAGWPARHIVSGLRILMRRCVGIHVGTHPGAVRATVPILLNTTHMVAITVNLNTIVSESLDFFLGGWKCWGYTISSVWVNTYMMHACQTLARGHVNSWECLLAK